jgi:hypothetical protein
MIGCPLGRRSEACLGCVQQGADCWPYDTQTGHDVHV